MIPNMKLNFTRYVPRFSGIQSVLGVMAMTMVMSMLSVTAGASTVDEKVVAAQLVFEGVVVDVQTRFAERENESDPAVPYRFVTYNINRILKGNYQNNTVTLRFMGGESEGGQVLLIPGQPLFDVGDHDLLMVNGNNRFPCPLVQCAQGRYRYLGGMVVNELGQRIYLDANGQIIMGETIEDEELTTNKLSENVTIETREVHEVGVGEISNVTDIHPDATTTDPAGFAQNVDEKIQTSHTSEQLANLPPFQSSDPDQPFVDETYEQAGVAAGQPPEQGGEENDAMPTEERLERELEAAMLAEMDQKSLDPELQAEQQALNKKMEQLHPEFFAGKVDTGIISAAHAEEIPLGGQQEEGTKTANSSSFMWIVAIALGLLVAAGFWFKRRRS